MHKIPEKIKTFLASQAACVSLLVVLGLTAYLNCLPNAMFWDDNDFILNNRFIQHWQYLPQILSENVIAGAHLVSNYWRPLLSLLFAVQWHLWADWVYGWHAVSVLFQIADSVLLFFFIKSLLNKQSVALLTAAMFLIHPAANEAVVYANSLGDGLSCFFVFGGLLLFTRFRLEKRNAIVSRNYWLALIAYPLALLSKETGILFLAYLILSDYLLQPEEYSFWHKLGRSLRTLWPFILMAAGYLLLRATVLNFSNSFNFYNSENSFTSNFGLRLLTFFQVMSAYAGLLFIPYELRVERMIQPPSSLAIPQIILGAAFFITLLTLAVRFFKKEPVVTFGIFWFFAGILPTSNLFVIINAVLYEHFLYTALAGIWLAVFWMALRWADTNPKKNVLILVFIVLFTAFTVRVVWRNTDWRTAIRFYEKLAPSAPNSYRVINNLGMEYAGAGKFDQAEPAYKQAVAIDPTNAVAYHNLGNLYLATNRTDAALAYFSKAIELQSNFIFSYEPLARIYISRGEFSQAQRILEQYFGLTDDKDRILTTLIELARKHNDQRALTRYELAQRQMHGQ